MNKPVKISQEPLCDEVWIEPMTSLAQKYRLSDAGLRKICKRIKIPLRQEGAPMSKEADAPSLRSAM